MNRIANGVIANPNPNKPNINNPNPLANSESVTTPKKVSVAENNNSSSFLKEAQLNDRYTFDTFVVLFLHSEIPFLQKLKD